MGAQRVWERLLVGWRAPTSSRTVQPGNSSSPSWKQDLRIRVGTVARPEPRPSKRFLFVFSTFLRRGSRGILLDFSARAIYSRDAMRVAVANFEKNAQDLLALLPFLAAMGPGANAALTRALGTAGNWRLLLRRVLLHLPRFSDEELNDAAAVEHEVHRRAEELARLLINVPETLLAPRRSDADLHETVFEPVPTVLAELVHRSWHYLATARNGTHLGLYAQPGGRPKDLLALATLSPLDIPHLVSILPEGHGAECALVVSRLVAAEGVPPNTMTYMMGRMFEWLRQARPDVRILLSYLNPNLAFQGSIYRASNWSLFAREPKRHMFYVDGNYATDREVIRQFGTNDIGALLRHNADRVSTSVQPLQSLDVFAYFLRSPERLMVKESSVLEVSPIIV